MKKGVKMRKVESIIDFGGGEIIDRINFELSKVISNINNVHTDEKPRKITVEISLMPENDRKSIKINTVVKSKISPIKAVTTAMVVQQDESKLVAFEADGLGDGQVDIFGEVHEVKYINLNSESTMEVKENE